MSGLWGYALADPRARAEISDLALMGLARGQDQSLPMHAVAVGPAAIAWPYTCSIRSILLRKLDPTWAGNRRSGVGQFQSGGWVSFTAAVLRGNRPA